MKRLKTLAIGFIVGSMCTTAATAFAGGDIAKFSLATNVKVVFDSVTKKMPTGKSVIIYDNNPYVPLNFISETMGYLVDWNGVTSTIDIKTPKSKTSTTTTTTNTTTIDNAKITSTTTNSSNNKILVDSATARLKAMLEAEAKANGTTTETATTTTSTTSTTTSTATDTRVYNQMPIKKSFGGCSVQVESVTVDDHYTLVNIYVRNEADGTTDNYQIEQTGAILEAKGKEYTFDLGSNKLDSKWYKDIKKGDYVNGSIAFPAIPADTEKVHFEVTVRNNSSINQEKSRLQFDIKLN